MEPYTIMPLEMREEKEKRAKIVPKRQLNTIPKSQKNEKNENNLLYVELN